jgi:heterodisulfide reductase subunit A2
MKKKIGKALVVGAGISGIRAALDLAELGYGVILIDRAPHVGGILNQLDYQFPSNHCGMCQMLPLVERDASSQFCLRKGLFHENIEILLSTQLAAMEGEPGRFQVTLHQTPTWVDPERCVGCNLCVEACPVEVPDEFNGGLSMRKAIYLPVPHNIPNPYVVDLDACNRCGECEKVCPTDAIRLAEDRRKEFRILVVDDERIVRESLQAWLEDEGYSVETAASGHQALEMIAAQPTHLMLADIKMPGMDGVELLKLAKETHPDLSVLMMTAYATVETAVEAMKIGALDYLIKPFDPEVMIPKVLAVYQDLEASHNRQEEVGAIVLCGGSDYFNPADDKNVYGYGVYPGVVTSLEFERILSGTGPCGGSLVRPHDGKPLKKVAWLQCVGSRDLQTEANFCSSVCCMYAIKEALLAKERCGGNIDTTIFYMDMRTFGKSFQRYRDQAETGSGVHFERGRIHSVTVKDANGDLNIRYVSTDGVISEENFDMLVLAVGQRPSPGTAAIAETAELNLNPWGFIETAPFSNTLTAKSGVMVGGSFSGLKDISESVIQSSAAAATASRIIHAAGGGLAMEDTPATPPRDVSRETPRILIALCTCGSRFVQSVDFEAIIQTLEIDPAVIHVQELEHVCTTDGWEALYSAVETRNPNRILIGACHPYLYIGKLKELGRRTGIDPVLMDVVALGLFDLGALSRDRIVAETNRVTIESELLTRLGMAMARLRRIDPVSAPAMPVNRKALVIGGGIAGMTAALTIADHGYPVVLVEKESHPGGNLKWLKRTIDGQSPQALWEDTIQRVQGHPNIDLLLETRVTAGTGQVGDFRSLLETKEGEIQTVEHGTAVLASGGTEASSTLYRHGTNPAIVTQKELEEQLNQGALDPAVLSSVVMIQCVGSREEPRNYCSRVCCPSALKHALYLKEQNPDISVYVLYRDMMTYGFTESYFTEARKAGVIFIPYTVDQKPEVETTEAYEYPVQVKVFEPIIGQPVAIDANLVVLATGIIPTLPAELAATFGVELDRDGFFNEAESKWRPVDSLKEGVFACGLAHSPRSIAESMATAEAAAMRSLRILAHEQLPAGNITATVRHALCSLCERCIETCPYSARMLDIDKEKVLVNPAMCQGCGACAAVCPNGASVLLGFSEQQMLEVIDAAIG